MIELGPLTRGALPIAEAAHESTLHCGQIALFASTHSGQACAVPYTDPSFDWLVRRHAEHLVGVYTDPGYKTSTLRQQLLEDIRQHLQPARAGRAA